MFVEVRKLNLGRDPTVKFLKLCFGQYFNPRVRCAFNALCLTCGGPIGFYREWGVTFKSPLVQRVTATLDLAPFSSGNPPFQFLKLLMSLCDGVERVTLDLLEVVGQTTEVWICLLDRCFSENFVLEKCPSPFEVETLTVRGVLLNKEEAIYVIECGFYVFLLSWCAIRHQLWNTNFFYSLG